MNPINQVSMIQFLQQLALCVEMVNQRLSLHIDLAVDPFNRYRDEQRDIEWICSYHIEDRSDFRVFVRVECRMESRRWPVHFSLNGASGFEFTGLDSMLAQFSEAVTETFRDLEMRAASAFDIL